MLPNRKGFDVLRDLRRPITTPVLMLTAKGDDFDRIFGLELGADDYLPKPFNPRDLIARISAILRRSGWQAKQERRSASSTYRFGRSGARYGDSHGNARRTRSEIDFYRV
jgi:two-component system response regulator CpxR